MESARPLSFVVVIGEQPVQAGGFIVAPPGVSERARSRSGHDDPIPPRFQSSIEVDGIRRGAIRS